MVKFSPEILENVHAGKVLQNLNDSKKLTEKKREKLYSEINEIAEISICQFVSHNHIDKNNINQSIWYGILKLVSKSKLDQALLLIDGNYNFSKYPAGNSVNYKSIIKGDERVISIAAASIMAKVERDRYMLAYAKKFSGYDFDKHKGYGTKKHIQSIKQLGYCPIHRRSYKLNLERAPKD